MEQSTDISFVVPCYNRADSIEKTISSIKCDAPDAEFIIVDDGSTDESWQIIQRHRDIIAVRTENRGVSSARNTGIGLATRKYVRFIDSDDAVPAGSSHALLSAAKEGEVPVGRANDRSYGFPILAADTIIPPYLLFRHTLPLGLSLIPRASLIEVNGLNESLRIGEDQELSVRLAQTGIIFRQIENEVYLVGHASSNRLTRDNQAKVFDSIIDTISALNKLTKSQDDMLMLGKACWAFGREASRNLLPDQASYLFSTAKKLAEKKAMCGPMPLLFLYRMFDPYKAELVLEKIKKAVRS